MLFFFLLQWNNIGYQLPDHAGDDDDQVFRGLMQVSLFQVFLLYVLVKCCAALCKAFMHCVCCGRTSIDRATNVKNQQQCHRYNTATG
jgi:hypothetical protein